MHSMGTHLTYILLGSALKLIEPFPFLFYTLNLFVKRGSLVESNYVNMT